MNPAKRKNYNNAPTARSFDFAQDDVRIISGSMSGIPRSACRLALNDEVRVRLRGRFNRPYKRLLCVKGGGIFVKKMTEGLFFIRLW